MERYTFTFYDTYILTHSLTHLLYLPTGFILHACLYTNTYNVIQNLQSSLKYTQVHTNTYTNIIHTPYAILTILTYYNYEWDTYHMLVCTQIQTQSHTYMEYLVIQTNT